VPKKYTFLDAMISDKLKQILLGGDKEIQPNTAQSNSKITSDFLNCLQKTGKTLKDLGTGVHLINHSNEPILLKSPQFIFRRIDEIISFLENDVEAIATSFSRTQVFKLGIANWADLLIYVDGGGRIWIDGTVLKVVDLGLAGSLDLFLKTVHWLGADVFGQWISADEAPRDRNWPIFFRVARTPRNFE
jgi:hypothetical protein